MKEFRKAMNNELFISILGIFSLMRFKKSMATFLYYKADEKQRQTKYI